MATYYWVGGSGQWDLTSTANWSTSSGGAGGAGVPTFADDVIFDANSFAYGYYVSILASVSCNNLTIGAPLRNTITFSSSSSWLFSIYGNLNVTSPLFVNMNIAGGGARIYFRSTSSGNTIRTNGWSCNCQIFFDGVGGSWTLLDALSTTNIITVNNGSLNTNGYSLSVYSISSSNSNTRSIDLGSSTVTLNSPTPITFTTSTGLTFSGASSTINLTATAAMTFAGGGQTFGNVNFQNNVANGIVFNGANTFNNLTFASSTQNARQINLDSNMTVNGTLTVSGTSATQREHFLSATIGTQVTITAAALSGMSDVDFSDIVGAGAATWSGTRLGNRRNNSGITFDAPKTVYWNLAGAQNWNATGWATSSGGTPAVNNFPLPQDTAVFDNTGSVTGTITMQTNYGYGTIDMSARTSAMTLAGVAASIYGNWLNGSGTTLSGAVAFTFSGSSTQSITSAGKTWTQSIAVNAPSSSIQLADALNIGANALTITAGTFTTGTNYSLSCLVLSSSNSNTRAITLGSSTVTTTGTSGFSFSTTTGLTFNAGTSTINVAGAGGNVNAGTSGGSGLTFYNLTISSGGAGANINAPASGFTTVSGTLSISPSNPNVSNLIASTTVFSNAAPSITGTGNSFGNTTFSNTAITSITISSATTFGDLTVTSRASAGISPISLGGDLTITGTFTVAGGTAPNRMFFNSSIIGTPITITANAVSLSDVDFRDITGAGSATWSGTRIGDAKGNSNITFDASKTVYWNLTGSVGWSATGWATSSGGTPAINNFPLAQDTAIFDNTGAAGTVQLGTSFNCPSIDMSARTNAMTWNITSTTGSPNMCGSAVTLGSGVTISGTTAVIFGGRTTQNLTSAGKTWSQALTINSPGGAVILADALNIGTNALTVTNGTFSTGSNYAVTAGSISSNNSNTRTINLNASTVTLSGSTPIVFTTTTGLTLTVSSGGSFSTLTLSAAAPTFNGNSLTYGNVTFSSTAITTATINGANTYNNFTITSPSAAGLSLVPLAANQTINGAFTVAGGTATNRVFVYSSTFGTAVVVTAGSVSLSDVDFRDINNTGTTWTGTRIGDCDGNSGITFTTGVNKYWNLTGSQNWTSTGWATSSGGTPAVANYPLPQDTAIFDNTGAATTVTVNGNWNLPSADFSGRTDAMTFATGSTTPTIYGSIWKWGSGLTISGTGAFTFSGKRTQTITSNSKAFTQPITVNSISGTLTIADALNIGANALTVTTGTFDTSSSNYAVTAGSISSSNSNTRAINLNASTITLSAATPVVYTTTTGMTYNAGTSTYTLTNASPTFNGAGLTHCNISSTGATTLTIATNGTFNNLSASNATLTIIGSNTFNDITHTGTTAASFASTNTVRDFSSTATTITVTGACSFRDFTGTATTTGTYTLTASSSFRDFSVTAPSSNGYRIVSVANNQTFTGAINTTSSIPTGRVRFVSSVVGRERTLSGITGATISDTDFQDMAVTGSGAPINGTRIGDLGGNSGITFSTPKTVYWNLSGAQVWSATGWATSSGGTPAAANFPLAQDTAVFDDTGSVTGTITQETTWYYPTIDFSARTSAMTFTTSTANMCGGFKNGTGVTYTANTNYWTFVARTGTIDLSCLNTRTVNNFSFAAYATATYRLTSAANINILTLGGGTFDANNYSVSLAQLFSSSTSVGTVVFGDSDWTISSLSPFSSFYPINFVFGSGKIYLTSTDSVVNIVFPTPTSQPYFPEIVLAGGATTPQTYNWGFGFTTKNISTTKTVAFTITCYSGVAVYSFDNWSLSGSAGNVINFGGNFGYVQKNGGGVVSADYLSISNNYAYPASTWYAGANSTDGGGNTNWSFTAPPGPSAPGNYLIMFYP